MTYDYRASKVFDPNRPNAKDYISLLFSDFIELHGDRLYADDSSLIGGIGLFHNYPVTVIGQLRGKNFKENIKYNCSMNTPEGYRKSLRLMKQAEKFGRCIICFVDTVGAYPGTEAEERGQASAIANNLKEMMNLKVPIISVLIGFGGSGGALAFCVADEIIMLQHSVLSVVSPRFCANILWKDSSRESEAAQLLKLTSDDMKRFGIADKIIKEPFENQEKNLEIVSKKLDEHILLKLSHYQKMNLEKMLELRYEKFRKIDKFSGIYNSLKAVC